MLKRFNIRTNFGTSWAFPRELCTAEVSSRSWPQRHSYAAINLRRLQGNVHRVCLPQSSDSGLGESHEQASVRRPGTLPAIFRRRSLLMAH